MLAHELNRILAKKIKEHGAQAGLSQKTKLSEAFVDGGFRMNRRGQAQIAFSEEEAQFAAKALLALTILRATYQKTEILTEEQAREQLGCPGLPPGFYALTPGLKGADGVVSSRKIAAAYLPEEVGSASKPFDDFEQALPSLVAGGWAAPQAFMTRFEVDPAVFAGARDPFADYMSIGGGMDEKEKSAARAQSLSVSLARQGLRITTVSSGGKPMFGFPAPVLLTGKASREAYKSEAHAKVHIRQDMSILSSLGDMASLPIYNHDAASGINNTRDIDDVLGRTKERAQIIATLVDAWMAKANIIHRFEPLDISMARMSGAQFEVFKKDAAENEVKSLGKPRKLFVKQGQSASFCDDGWRHLILSMDMALVDGQHSSRDYGLIAAACLGAKGDEEPSYMGVGVPDCKPSVVADLVWNRYVDNWVSTGLNPEGFDEAVVGGEIDRRAAEQERARLKEDDGDKGVARSVPKRSEAARACAKKVWEGVAAFAPSLTVEVVVAATVDPSMSRVYTLMENAVREQRIDAKAMAKHHGLVQSIVASFNQGAEAFEDPIRLAAVKSQHANPDMSTADDPAALAIDFVDLFPYVKAVLNAERTAGARSFKPNEAGDPGARAADWAKWEALGILESKGVRVESVRDPLFLDLSTRLASLALAVEGLKGREFELNGERLLKTGEQLVNSSFAPKLKAFAVVAMGCAMKLLAGMGFKPKGLKKDAENKEVFDFLSGPGMDAQRIYAVCKMAMRLKAALRPHKRSEKSMANGLMNDTTLDNVMLTLLTTTARVEEVLMGSSDPAHPASEKAVAYLQAARVRLDGYGKNMSALSLKSFNATREAFVSRMDKDKLWELGAFQKAGLIGESSRRRAVEKSVMLALEREHPHHAALLIDAIPGPGVDYAKIGAVEPKPKPKPGAAAKLQERRAGALAPVSLKRSV